MVPTILFGLYLMRGLAPDLFALDTDQQVVNIRDFGATGDGQHDDSAALRSALASAPDGGTLYIPTGTYIIDPAAQSFYLKSNLTIKGDGDGSVLKVKDHDGDYEFIFMPKTKTTEVDNITFRNFTIDQNIANNPEGRPVANKLGTAECAIFLGAFHHAMLDSVRFIHTPAINTAVFNAVGSSDVTVQNCTFQWQKARNAPSDVSMIYTDCDHQKILNNTFNCNFSDQGVTAIELHGHDVTVSGNTVYGFRKGMNITSFNPGSPQTEDGTMDIAFNTFTVSTAGISLWSFKGRTLSNVHIHDNIINIVPDDSPDPAIQGIGLTRELSGRVSGDYNVLYIENNTINYVGTRDSDVLYRLGSHHWSAYDVAGIAFSPPGHVKNARIVGNKIIGAIHQGIVIGDITVPGDDQPRMSNVAVQGNTISEVVPLGMSGPPPVGVVVQGRVDGIVVQGNSMSFKGGKGGVYTKTDKAVGGVMSDR